MVCSGSADAALVELESMRDAGESVAIVLWDLVASVGVNTGSTGPPEIG